MAGEIELTDFLPAVVVAPLVGCAPLMVLLAVDLLEVLGAVASFVRCEIGAAGIPAGALWFAGHEGFLFLSFFASTTRDNRLCR